MKLLLIVPHPDDEVYGAAGTIMDFVEAGHTVGLVTLTRGEAGRSLGLADSPQELARLRGAELAACLAEIGVQVHHQHDYPDGGLAEVPEAELSGLARQYLERYRPDILLTFAPNGSNGHRDHVATSAAVRAAWQALPEGERPELWFYAGPPPKNEALLASYLPPTLTRDVTRFLTRKLRAIACHRSQALSTVDFVRQFPERIPSETFHVAWRREGQAALQ